MKSFGLLESFLPFFFRDFLKALMSKESKEIYEFGPFRLDVGEHIFERSDGEKNPNLPEKAFQTLVVLIRNHGRLISKTELLNAVWPDSFVEENNLDSRDSKCVR